METRVLPASPESIAEAAAALRRGDLVGMPTETVYGLAGNAFDPHALASIFAAKERPSFDPLSVHIGGAIDATGLVDLSAIEKKPERRLHLFRTADTHLVDVNKLTLHFSYGC